MKRFLPLLPVLCLAAASVVPFTKAELDAHKAWMDDAQDKKDDVREALGAKDSKKLLEAASAIDKLTDKERKFWARTGNGKAKDLAGKNRTEAREMLEAAREARFDVAGEAFGRLEKTCSSCHDLHFEKDWEKK